MDKPATLYYDGACPLCTTEISALRRHACGLNFVDVHELPAGTDLPDRAELLKRLHLQDSGGEMTIGLDANIRMWQYTRFGWLWRILDWPVIRPLAELAYEAWARRRYDRRYGS